MAIRMDQIPAPAPRPCRPRIWLWLSLLAVFLAIGALAGGLFAGPQERSADGHLWAGLALAASAWATMSFSGLLAYVGKHQVAQGWDDARQLDIEQRQRCGRRSQQVLATSVLTPLRVGVDRDPARQLAGLQAGVPLLQSGAPGMTPSEPATLDSLEEAVATAMASVLRDLAASLALLPAEQPLALSLSIDSGIEAPELAVMWRRAWRDSGIRQSATMLDGAGLAVLDHWLDWRIADPALLMLVALRFSPSSLEGGAQTSAGLLLGNRLTQTGLAPLAYLHRPEQQRGDTPEALRDAINQALDWVPLAATAIQRIWLAGTTQRYQPISTALSHSPLGQDGSASRHCLDTVLGTAAVSAWLAVAAAAQSIQAGEGAQFILSGEDAAPTGLWCTVVTPVPPAGEKDIK